MAITKVADIIRRVQYIIQDDGVRWSRRELLAWLNEGYAAITAVRPDASVKADVFYCRSGTRHVLISVFPRAVRLLDVIRNMAEQSSGRVVRVVFRAALDDRRPDQNGFGRGFGISWPACCPSDYFSYHEWKSG